MLNNIGLADSGKAEPAMQLEPLEQDVRHAGTYLAYHAGKEACWPAGHKCMVHSAYGGVVKTCEGRLSPASKCWVT